MPRIACVQMDVQYGDREANTQRIIDHVRSLASEGVEMIVFPECAIGGYCVSEVEQCADISIERDSVWITRIQQAVDEADVYAIFGFAERDGGSYYNTAALLSPAEAPRFYRKTHLPELGYDRFVRVGDELPVFDTKHGKIGILICFDVRFPEASRVLAMKGADAIFLPTNWPRGADISADVLALSRASENKVFVFTTNRAGDENGFHFIGKSKVINPFGVVLKSAGEGEEVLVADVDFLESRNKRVVTIPGKHETTIFESRRPELYGSILVHTVPIAGKTQ